MIDLVVIGAGPAGLAAATLAAEIGLSVELLDEQDSPGGQIYRSLTSSPLKRRAILGADYWQGEPLVAAFTRSAARYRAGATVWSVEAAGDGFTLVYSLGGESSRISARKIIIAAGAQERPFPIPGWTLPGVMSAGAAQIMLKSAGAIPAGPIAIAGCGPLLYRVAAQLLAAGADVAGIFDTLERARMFQALPFGFAFLRSPYFAAGGKLLGYVNDRVKVVRGMRSLAAVGSDRVEALRFEGAEASGSFPIACLLLHHGVVPALNLSAAVGCRQEWDERLLCWRPAIDAWGESTVGGVYVAGDAAGIAGAEAAEKTGRLAALAIAASLNRIAPAERDERAGAHRRELRSALRGRKFIDTLFVPPACFRLPEDDTIVCRCEEVTAGEIRALVRKGCTGPNQLKAFSRCGMGPCQGRMCGLTVTELIAHERKVDPASVGYFRVRFPLVPVTLGELASLPHTPADEAAVVRAYPGDETRG